MHTHVRRSGMGAVGVLLLLGAPGRVTGQQPQGPPPPAWRTDTTKAIIALDSLSRTGRRDGIPAIDDPKFESQADAARWLGDRDPVVALAIGTDVRAYPVSILMHHDAVNDVVNGVPVAVTFCILCGSAIAYDRRFDDQVLSFGYAGMLYNSNLVLYDRQTETWWGQIVGQGLVGRYAGRELTRISAPTMSFKEYRRQTSTGTVLSRDTGFERPYGEGRLKGYDEDPNPIRRIFQKETDVRLPAKERVLVLDEGDDIVAIPFSALVERKVITTRVGGRDAVVWWSPWTASIYADRVADGKDVGAAAGFDPVVDGRRLTFRATVDGSITDRQTGSIWSFGGRAVSGPLEGKTLTPIDDGVHFWFVWAAYRPETRVVGR